MALYGSNGNIDWGTHFSDGARVGQQFLDKKNIARFQKYGYGVLLSSIFSYSLVPDFKNIYEESGDVFIDFTKKEYLGTPVILDYPRCLKFDFGYNQGDNKDVDNNYVLGGTGTEAKKITTLTVKGRDIYGNKLEESVPIGIGTDGTNYTNTKYSQIGSKASEDYVYNVGYSNYTQNAYHVVDSVFLNAEVKSKKFIISAGAIYGVPYRAFSYSALEAIFGRYTEASILPDSLFIRAGDPEKDIAKSNWDVRGLFAKLSLAGDNTGGEIKEQRYVDDSYLSDEDINNNYIRFTYYVRGADQWINQMAQLEGKYSEMLKPEDLYGVER